MISKINNNNNKKKTHIHIHTNSWVFGHQRIIFNFFLIIIINFEYFKIFNSIVVKEYVLQPIKFKNMNDH
jgi:hypothetical protein